MHPKGDPELVSALRFQPEPPNGCQQVVKSLAEVRGTRSAEPVPLSEIFGAFAVNVVVGILHVAAQVTLARNDEAHVQWRRQNAGPVPLYFGWFIHGRVNGTVRQFMVSQPVLRDQFGRVAQVQRRVGIHVYCAILVRHIQYPHNFERFITGHFVESIRQSRQSSDDIGHVALLCELIGLICFALLCFAMRLDCLDRIQFLNKSYIQKHQPNTNNFSS
jgi:hypothetical protein